MTTYTENKYVTAYTEDKKIQHFRLNADNFIGSGDFGKTFLTSDNKCLKVFDRYPSRKEDKAIFNEDIFNIIKEIKPQNFYTLYELYFNRTLTKIVAYLSKYYPQEDINILTMPVDYTFDNLYALYKSFSLLAEHNVCVSDTSDSNVILSSSTITIIDTDMYYINNNKKVSALKNNMYNLGSLFTELYTNSLNEKDAKKRVQMVAKIRDLFMPVGTLGMEPVIKKLIKYKYPIDYLQKK